MKRVISLICALAVCAGFLNMAAVSVRAAEAEPVPQAEVSEAVPPQTEAPVPPQTEPAPPATEPAGSGNTTAPTKPEKTQIVRPAKEAPAQQNIDPNDPFAPRSYCAVPLYLQTNYPHIRYGSGTIADSGCSVTSLAMVATYLTGHTYLPDELTAYFATYVGDNLMDKLEYMSDELQLPWERAENFHVALNALKEGKIVIALMGAKSLFTTGQHCIVLAGINEDGKILVNDPNGENYSRWDLKRAFVNGFREGDISYGYSGAWIYDPAKMPEEPFLYEAETVEVECRYPGLELSADEEDLLARMVWVEAQGEVFEGQQAIAEVVLNRLKSHEFQDTVTGIIQADNQFRSTAYLDQAKPTSVQYEAIRRAIEGPYVLPEEVVHFATYPVTDHVWGEIGGHTFCYPWLDVE